MDRREGTVHVLVTAGVTSITITRADGPHPGGRHDDHPGSIDATSTKPEVSSTLDLVTLAMKQVAGVQTGVPNVYLEQPQIETVIENDLRLSVYDGLDELVRAAIASSGGRG